MVWHGTNRLFLAEHRLRIVSPSACVAKGESTRNGPTFANSDEHADNNPTT